LAKPTVLPGGGPKKRGQTKKKSRFGWWGERGGNQGGFLTGQKKTALPIRSEKTPTGGKEGEKRDREKEGEVNPFNSYISIKKAVGGGLSS